MLKYCFAVCGAPGSGKSTLCLKMSDLLKQLGRKVKVVNLDPANDNPVYNADVNIDDLVQVSEVMEALELGPNGALIHSMEYLEKNIDWLISQFKVFEANTFIIIDFPGQVELYTHHNSVKNIFEKLQIEDYRLCAIYMVDSYCCRDPGSYIGFLTMTLASMLQMAVPQVNVLSKIDVVPKYKKRMAFGLDFYSEVLDLEHLVETLNEDPFTGRFKKLNRALAGVIEAYGLVTFSLCTIQHEESVFGIIKKADLAVGYLKNSTEEESKVQEIIKSKDDTEMRELVSRMNEKYVYSK